MWKETMSRGKRGATRSALGGALGLFSLLAVAAGASAEQPGSHQLKPSVDASLTSYASQAGLSGGLTIAGSDTMQPIMVRLASVFKLWQPDVKIAVQGGGSVTALHAFLLDEGTMRRGDGNPRGTHQASGHVDLLASSNPLTQEERTQFQTRYGYDVTEIPIALDAVAIYVNRQNPIQELSLDQVDAIFGKDRKRGHDNITTWGQLGAKGEWEQAPIRLYGRDKRSGTRAFLKHVVLMDGELKDEVREEPGSASEILAISRDRLGIGYAGIEFQGSFVQAVPLAEKAGLPAASPDANSVIKGTYPLSRFLYLYVKKNPNGAMDQQVLAFLKFVHSREGQEAVVKAGVFPLTSIQANKNLEALIGAPVPATALNAASQ